MLRILQYNCGERKRRSAGDDSSSRTVNLATSVLVYPEGVEIPGSGNNGAGCKEPQNQNVCIATPALIGVTAPLVLVLVVLLVVTTCLFYRLRRSYQDKQEVAFRKHKC
ncbi:hypothetical protein MAR_009890 [Mya arenaria]|uniref:Uncharacterized protein n=1 Tax=Mya arenaria TaxID=6604 RepID=A0ABY7E312_MYAAR|nr:hypothetical protein MAR_009890 [Mya arenaria]